MKKQRLLLTSLLILLLLAGGLTYRNVNIRVLDSMENPTCTGLQVRSAPFLFVDTQQQFQADKEMKVIETLIWTENFTPVLALPSAATASYTTYQILRESGEPVLFYVNEQQRDQACGLSTIFNGPSATLRESGGVKWTEQTLDVSDPASSGYSASVIWTIRNDDRLIVMELPDILRDLIKPAAEETFLKLAV
jgi:hypothetical protein